MHVTFDPSLRFSKIRYRWNPWTKPSSTHPMTSFCAMMVFPPFWISSKTFKRLYRSQHLSDQHQTSHGVSPDYALFQLCFFSSELLPFARNSQSNIAAKPPNRKWAHISATLAGIKTKLCTWTHVPIRRTLKTFGDFWPLGGAAIKEKVF